MKTLQALVIVLACANPAAAQLPTNTLMVGWDAVPEATGYRVTVDGVITEVGLPPVRSSCACLAVPVTVVPARTHTLTVSAYSPLGVSLESEPLVLPAACAADRPLSACWSLGAAPMPWSLTDVGVVQPPGDAAQGPSGRLTLRAGGLQMAGNQDAFAFASVLSTSGSVTARVTELSTGRAGLDWREDTTAGARHVAISVTPSGLADLLVRAKRGGSTRIVTTKALGPLPVWVRLTRGSGNVWTAAHSADGQTWLPIGSVTQALASSLRLGLFALGASSSVATIAQFESIEVP